MTNQITMLDGEWLNVRFPIGCELSPYEVIPALKTGHRVEDSSPHWPEILLWELRGEVLWLNAPPLGLPWEPCNYPLERICLLESSTYKVIPRDHTCRYA